MASKARRRILLDIATLQQFPPADFFLPPVPPPSDDLSSTTIFLVGPASTPFEGGLFQIVLRIPSDYPQAAPRVHFRTQIFHPNIDERTGDVCVDTIKRDWNDKLTLVDVCAVVRCLLVYPNPDSSLNDDAGSMFRDSYEEWAARARMFASIHAKVPQEYEQLVEETRLKSERGDIVPAGELLKNAIGETKRKRRDTNAGKPPRGASPIQPSDTEMMDAPPPPQPITNIATTSANGMRSGKENADGSFSKPPATPTSPNVELAIPAEPGNAPPAIAGPSMVDSPRKRGNVDAEMVQELKGKAAKNRVFSSFDLNASDAELAKAGHGGEKNHSKSSTGVVANNAEVRSSGTAGAAVEQFGSGASKGAPSVKKTTVKKRNHPPPKLGLKRY